MEEALMDAARWGDLPAAELCLAACILWLYSITSGTYMQVSQNKEEEEEACV